MKKKGFFKKFLFMSLALMTCILPVGTAFAGETGGTGDNVVFEAVQGLVTSLLKSITVGEIAALLGLVIASCAGFVLFWFGARKLISSIMAAFKKGKLKIG